MNKDVFDQEATLEQLKQQAIINNLRVTIHGHQEMVEENITYDSVREAIINGIIIENYPEHQRGPCCLLCGKTHFGRYLHVVCTTSLEIAIIITVYKPKPPKWITPFQRRKQI